MKAPGTYLPLMLAAIILLSAPSCSDRSGRVRTALTAADSLMMTRPQAALDSLNGIDSTEVRKMGSLDRAFYTLLTTEARYKCYLPVAKDTAISEAVRYYRRRGPEDRLARALTMQGAVLSERGDPEGAMAAYKEAEPIVDKGDNKELAGLLHTRIGELYHTTFSDAADAIFHYRTALQDFEDAGAEYRLAAANLTLSRMLLRDSADTGREFFIKGTSCAELHKDTLNLIESANQEAQFLSMHEKAYLQAARISGRMLNSCYRKWMTKPALNSFCKIAAESYLESGRLDSTNFFLSQMTAVDATDSLLVHSVMRKMAEIEGDMAQYLKHDRRISEIVRTVNDNVEELSLKDKETEAEIRYAILEAKYKTVLAVSAATAFLLIAALAIILVVRYRKSAASMMDHINKGTDAINMLTGTDGNDTEADDLRRFSEAIERMTANRKESLEKTARTSAEMMSVLDSILTSYYKYKNPETFQRQVEISLGKHKKTILTGAEDIVHTIYPGFMEKLAKKYGDLTRKDRLIIILTLCGFSSDGICWLTGIKTESLAVYKSNINRKMGYSGKLSDNLFRMISEDFHQFRHLKSFPETIVRPIKN